MGALSPLFVGSKRQMPMCSATGKNTPIVGAGNDEMELRMRNRMNDKIVSCLTLSLGLSAAAATKVLAIPTGYIYWSDTGTDLIERSDLNGLDRQTVVSGLLNPAGVHLTVSGEKVYWCEQTPTRVIRRANLDGSGVETVGTMPTGNPAFVYDLAVDQVRAKIYWNWGSNIMRANLNGTGQETVYTGSGLPFGVALDTSAGMIYWTERLSGYTGCVRKANLDGTAVQTLVTTGPNSLLYDLDLDLAGGRIYWVNVHPNVTTTIDSSNLDGSGTTVLVEKYGLSDIVIDRLNRKMYWTDTSQDRIQRADLDGRHIENVVTTGLSTPLSLDLLVIPEPGALALLGCASLVLVRRRR